MTYFTTLEMESEALLRKLVVKQLGVESWLSECLNDDVRQLAAEAFATASILRWNVKQMLLDTCRLRKEQHMTLCCSFRGITVCYLSAQGELKRSRRKAVSLLGQIGKRC